MLDQRRRRWTSSKPTKVYCMVLAGCEFYSRSHSSQCTTVFTSYLLNHFGLVLRFVVAHFQSHCVLQLKDTLGKGDAIIDVNKVHDTMEDFFYISCCRLSLIIIMTCSFKPLHRGFRNRWVHSKTCVPYSRRRNCLKCELNIILAHILRSILLVFYMRTTPEEKQFQTEENG